MNYAYCNMKKEKHKSENMFYKYTWYVVIFFQRGNYLTRLDLPKTNASCILFISAKTYTMAVDTAMALETGAPRNHTALGLCSWEDAAADIWVSKGKKDRVMTEPY